MLFILKKYLAWCLFRSCHSINIWTFVSFSKLSHTEGLFGLNNKKEDLFGLNNEKRSSVHLCNKNKKIIYFQKTKTKMSLAKLRAAIEAQQSPARRGAGGGGGGGGDNSRNKKSVIEVSLFIFVFTCIYVLNVSLLSVLVVGHLRTKSIIAYSNVFFFVFVSFSIIVIIVWFNCWSWKCRRYCPRVCYWRSDLQHSQVFNRSWAIPRQWTTRNGLSVFFSK